MKKAIGYLAIQESGEEGHIEKITSAWGAVRKGKQLVFTETEAGVERYVYKERIYRTKAAALDGLKYRDAFCVRDSEPDHVDPPLSKNEEVELLKDSIERKKEFIEWAREYGYKDDEQRAEIDLAKLEKELLEL